MHLCSEIAHSHCHRSKASISYIIKRSIGKILVCPCLKCCHVSFFLGLWSFWPCFICWHVYFFLLHLLTPAICPSSFVYAQVEGAGAGASKKSFLNYMPQNFLYCSNSGFSFLLLLLLLIPNSIFFLSEIYSLINSFVPNRRLCQRELLNYLHCLMTAFLNYSLISII